MRTMRVKELNEVSQDQAEDMKVEGAEDVIACPVCGAATVQNPTHSMAGGDTPG